MKYPDSSFEQKDQTPRNRQGLRFGTRLTIGVMIITGLAVFFLGYFTVNRRQQNSQLITSLVKREVRLDAEEEVANIAQAEAQKADDFLRDVSRDVNLTTAYVQTLLAQEALLGRGEYWHADNQLTRFGENQWGNSPQDPASVLAPSTFDPTPENLAEINTTIHLDFIAPQLLEANPNLLALYYVNTQGVTTYYPNIDLANIVGDFDARQRPYYLAVVPEANSARETSWTSPYYDAALNGLVETHSQPVYDNNDVFRGVVAADVLLTTITDQIANIQIGRTGYAFLVDADGRFIVLNDAAKTDLGLDAEGLPEGEIPELTIFDSAEQIRQAADQMVAGGNGLITFTRNGDEFFLAYAPVASTGYSLGLIVPVNEMTDLFLTVDTQVRQENQSSLQVFALVVALVLSAALIFAYVIGRFITRPLEELTKAAEEISTGNLDVDVASDAGGEIGTLAAAFNQMTHQIKDLVSSLEQRVSDRTQALQTSLEVSRSISTILDPQELFTEVVEQVKSAFDYYHAQIYIVDSNTGNLIMAGGTGEVGRTILEGGHKLQAKQGLVGRSADTNSVILVPDVNKETGWLPNPLLPDTKAEIAVPIAIGDEVLGVLDVQHDQIDGLTQEDAQLLQSVASQVAIALRNAQMYSNMQEQALRETRINEINRQIKTAASIEDILKTTSRELGYALNAKRIKVKVGNSQPIGYAQETRGES